MIKPEPLKIGDTIGIISPSSPLAGLLPHRLEYAIKNLEELGFKVKLSKNVLAVINYTAGSVDQRVDDIHEMFSDKNISAIMCAIGGFHSNQIINKLDYELIKQNPKIFIGFSDITVLHFALNTQADLTTFYGPNAIPQFGGSFGVDEYTKSNFLSTLVQNAGERDIVASSEWTDEFLDWFTRKDQERPQLKKPNLGYEWLKEGVAEGQLIGGCITSLLHLRGTKFWPDFKGKIFFWEIPESTCEPSLGEAVSRVDAHLADLELSGVFDQISGMIIGRPKGYDGKDIDLLKKIILKYSDKYGFPILYNVDIGHTDPMTILPIGAQARIDSSHKIEQLKITEPATVSS